MANTNRTKGHNFERLLARLFRDIGYKKCITTRQGSRLLDNCKVDLMHIPYNVQAKYVTKGKVKYSQIFQDMTILLSKNFPSSDKVITLPKMIFHKSGRKKSEQLVIMQQHEFVELLKELSNDEKESV